MAALIAVLGIIYRCGPLRKLWVSLNILLCQVSYFVRF